MAAIKVLETNVLHASDVLYWLDGTTAEMYLRRVRCSRTHLTLP